MSATTAPPLVLVLFKGHPSSGKSSLARLVCRQLRWPLLDKDDARDALQPHHAAQQQQQQQGQALVLLDANAVSYDIMFAFAATQLSLGVSAALDCPFARPELFDRAAALAARHGAVLAVVDCVAGDEAVWRQRLEARGRAQAGGPQGHKPCTWSDVQQLLQRYGGSHKWSTDGSRRLEHHCTVDTTALSLQQAGEQVLTFLGAVQVKQQAQQQQQQQQTVGVRAG